MMAPRRFRIERLVALLAAVSIGAGIGLAALASGTDFGPRGPLTGAEPASEVLQLPRITVTPSGASESDSALQSSERCTRLHC